MSDRLKEKFINPASGFESQFKRVAFCGRRVVTLLKGGNASGLTDAVGVRCDIAACPIGAGRQEECVISNMIQSYVGRLHDIPTTMTYRIAACAIGVSEASSQRYHPYAPPTRFPHAACRDTQSFENRVPFSIHS